MNRSLILVVSVIWSLAVSASASQVPDFALIDQNGRFHQLSRHVDKQAVVLFVHSNGCDESKTALPEFLSLQKRFRNAPVSFQVLVADPAETRDSLAALARRYDSDVPFLLDQSQLVSDALGLSRASEVLVINPSRNEVIYRGGVGLYADNPLQQALAANLPGMTSHLHYIVHSIVRGEPFVNDPQPARGAPLALERIRDLRNRTVSYENEVAPILVERCVSCHRNNGMAPWAMDSHLMVQGWSAMIKETLLTRRMPPGQIDYEYAERFEDVHHISHDEIATLVRWIETGAIKASDEGDPLESIEVSGSVWELGEPDLIIEFPEHKIPATGILAYTFVPLDIGLSEDKWVSAYAFDVGDKAALHHVIVYTQDARQRRQNASGGGSRTNFGGYAPGREHVVLADNTGIRLRKDMRFMIQFHYTTVGRETVDRSRLGLYFRETSPERELTRTAIMNGDFVIPPGAREFPVTASTVFPRDTWLYSFAPHMHYRGKHIRFAAVYPDGRRESLLSIPNFQHNWQMVYRLKEPILLPAGTEIIAEGAFDNSRFNPLNPDPAQRVTWGEQVWDEMFITWMRVSDVQ
jgi:peroxiredoxin